MLPIRIQYEWTLPDATEMYAAQWRKYWRVRYAFYVIVALGLLLTPIWLMHQPDVQYVSWLGLIGGLVLGHWLYNSLPSKYAAHVAKGHTSPYEAEIDEVGIKTFRTGARMQLEWAAFHQSLETENCFALFYESIFFPFPKRAFTPEQLAEFRELLARKIPQKK